MWTVDDCHVAAVDEIPNRLHHGRRDDPSGWSGGGLFTGRAAATRRGNHPVIARYPGDIGDG
jgi:hypothetical protein